MGKIAGNIVIFCILCATMLLDAARVTMELHTENGRNEVVIGQPCRVDVVIEDVHGSVQAPEIKGLDGIKYIGSGINSLTINGKSTIRYAYQVRIDNLGSYLLGPAIVRHQQQEFVSNQVRVTVVKDPGIAAQKNKNNTIGTKAFLRLMIDPETVVVGQKISCSLRFYYQDQSISLHAIGRQELPGFTVKDTSQLETGLAEIDGSQYRYCQWRWDMYPTKPGECIIPAYNADYDIPSKDDNDLLSHLYMFFNHRVERKRVYSNAATIKVLPLPHFDGDVHAVGLFERFSAYIKPGIAKEGEGMELVLEIEGAGDLQAIATPKLNMPDALKYYDSNSVISAPQHTDELPKKRFEFIVQGMKSGDYEIPEQLFTYFDIERNAFVTLRTPPLAVSIMPGMVNAKKDISAPSASGYAEQKGENNADIADINAIGEWYYVEQRQPLQWWIFYILFMLPAFCVGYPIAREWYDLFTRNSGRVQRRRAFRKAHKKIDRALRLHDDTGLYAIFTELFQELNCTIARGTIAEWDDFFERIAHAAYAKAIQSGDTNTSELCRMAKQWLERLEKIV